MKDLFLLYLNAGFLGSVIILVGLLLRPIFRQAPRRILCTVWLLAAIRLLLPFHIESYFSLQPQYESFENVVQEQLSESAPPEDTPSLDVPNQDISPELPPDNTPAAPEPSTRPTDWVQFLSGIWVAGMAGIILYCIISYIALKHRIRTAVPCGDGVMESEHITGAFLLGYWKPRIYLPIGLGEKDRAFIIAHEQTHILRWDHWWKLLGLVCTAVHWYNPLVWIGFALLCRDIEITCDERVICSMDLAERKAYSQALLNSEKRRFGLLECPVAFGEVDLKQRIRNVLAYHPYGYWLTAFAISLVVFVGFCFLTSPVAESRQGPDLTPPATLSTKPTQQTEPSTTEPTQPTVPPTTIPPTTIPPTTVSPPTIPPVTEPPVTEPPAADVSATNPQGSSPAPDLAVIAATYNIYNKPIFLLTSDGTLTIYGDTEVTNYHAILWRKHSDKITKVVITEGLTQIMDDAFRDMNNLTEVYLCESLTTIGSNAFYECDNLRSIRIPVNVTLIKDHAFARCLGLTTVEFAQDSKLKEIRQYAFASVAITSFSTPPELEKIGIYAFSGCWRLEKVVLAGSIEEVEIGAFSNCTRLKHVVLGPTLKRAIKIFPGCDAIETVENHSAFPFETFVSGGDLPA